MGRSCSLVENHGLSGFKLQFLRKSVFWPFVIIDHLIFSTLLMQLRLISGLRRLANEGAFSVFDLLLTFCNSPHRLFCNLVHFAVAAFTKIYFSSV